MWQPWTLATMAGRALAYLPVWFGFVQSDLEIRTEAPEHFAWAVLVMAQAQLACLPLTLAGYAVYRRLRRAL